MSSPSFLASEYFRERWLARNASGLSPVYLKHINRLSPALMRELAKCFSTKKHRTKVALSGLSDRKRQPRSRPVVAFNRLAVIEGIINKMIANGKI